MPPVVEEPVDLKSALCALGAADVPWHIMLDAAQEPPVMPAAREAGVYTTCLYTGEFGRRLDEVAPHLAAYDPASPLTAWLERHWHRAHGIFLQSDAPFEEVRRHVKRFLMVKSPEGRNLRFRFYDPRVLRAFLPVCTSRELVEFFGPVRTFFAAGRPGPSLLSFSLARQQLVTRSKPLGRPGFAAAADRFADLHVVVLDADLGTPIERAAVVIQGEDRRSAVTGASGRVRFRGLPVGSYMVSSIDAARRAGRSPVELRPDTEPVFLLCRNQPA